MVDVQAQSTAMGVAFDLRDAGADNPDLVGAKAAKLSRAVHRGLPVLPGFALLATRSRRLALSPDDFVALYDAWSELSDNGSTAVVVRSSSTAEDGATSSMAGLFESVLDVQGWSAFLEAIEKVRRSAGEAPMAVLVQPMLRPVIGGVLFGADPVTGDTSREVVAVVEGGPDELVSGRSTGTYHVLNRHGRLLDVRPGPGGATLTTEQRRGLHRLARRLERQFGGPQDIEWAWDKARGLVLLQTRPITAGIDAAREGVGPLLGPGPVAETFPEPLAPLERDLWLGPLSHGLAEALVLAGVATRRRLSRSPVVRTVGGRAVVDLDVFGLAPPKHKLLHRLDPRPPARRVIASWRRPPARRHARHRRRRGGQGGRPHARRPFTRQPFCGPTRRPPRAHRPVAGVRARLRGPHGPGDPCRRRRQHAAGEALRALAEGRGHGAVDDDIVADSPVVLALVPPRIGRSMALPPTAPITIVPDAAPADPAVELREALRLRARWLQELSARAAVELQHRLDLGFDIAVLSLIELRAVVNGAAVPEAALPAPPGHAAAAHPLPGRQPRATWSRCGRQDHRAGHRRRRRSGHRPRAPAHRLVGPARGRRPRGAVARAGADRLAGDPRPGWSPRPAASCPTWPSWPGSWASRSWWAWPTP